MYYKQRCVQWLALQRDKIEVQCSVPAKSKSFSGNNTFFTLKCPWPLIIVNPPLTIGDYKREDILSFFPVHEEGLIRNIRFKFFETYILSCQFRNIYLLNKVNIFRREQDISVTSNKTTKCIIFFIIFQIIVIKCPKNEETRRMSKMRMYL